MKEIFLKEDEVLEDLQFKDLKIIQNKNLYRFTSDAVLLANFVSVKKGARVIDLGSGSGIISILIATKNAPEKVLGIEIQSELAEMARRSVECNGLEKIVGIHNLDMKTLLNPQFREKVCGKEFDVVVSNPPYKKVGTSTQNGNQSKAIARHEIKIDMQNLIKVANSLLKFGGSFYVMYDAERTAELLCCLKQNKLEPKRMFFTQASENTNAILVVVDAVKGGKVGLKVLPTLITNEKDGKYLETIKDFKF